MFECECLAGCPFFNDNMKGLDIIKDILKKRLCKGDNTSCARYMVFKALGKPAVPSNLYPNQIEEAKLIIAKAGL